MVDLLLLITFFMLTTTLSKPQSMSLGLPDKNEDDKNVDIKVDENRTATLLLGDNNKLTFYMGLLETPIAGPNISYGREGVRKVMKRKEEVLAYSTAKGKPDQGMIVIKT
jgi:hypothetical protein